MDDCVTFDPEPVDMDAELVNIMLQKANRQDRIRGKRGPDQSTRADVKPLILEALAGGPLRLSRLLKRVVTRKISDTCARRAVKELVADGKVIRWEPGGDRKAAVFELPRGEDGGTPPLLPLETWRAGGHDATAEGG